MEKEQAATQLTELVTVMVRSLVDQPDEVRVSIDPREAGRVKLDVTVARGDLGKVIGKVGRTARSMRTILGAASMTCQMPSSLNILEGDHVD